MSGTGGKTVRVALACCRSAVRGSVRQAVALALLTGLLGGVALGAVAGARRTDSAYGRYLDGDQRQRRLRQRGGSAARPAAPQADHADLLAARRGRARHLHRALRPAGGARPGGRRVPDGQRQRQPGRRVLQPGPGDRPGGPAAAAGVDDHGDPDAGHREDVRHRGRRHGQLPVPVGERTGPAVGQAVHPVLPGGGHRRDPARAGRRLRRRARGASSRRGRPGSCCPSTTTPGSACGWPGARPRSPSCSGAWPRWPRTCSGRHGR